MLLASAISCGGADDAGPSGPLIRFIEEEPSESLAAVSLTESTSVRAWEFPGESERLAGWAITDSEGTYESATSEGVHLEADDERVLLAWSGALDGADFDSVQVELDAVEGAAGTGTVAFAWGGEGEALAPDREIIDPGGEASGDGVRTYRFRLRGHPGWRPRLSRLRLAFHHPPGGVVVRRISLVREATRAEELAGLVGRGVKAELDAEVRNALVGIPGVPVRLPLTVPAGATLRLSYGVPASLFAPVRFRVWFEPADGARELLFEDVLEGVDDSDRWHQASVGLVGLVGTGGHVELETTVDGSFDPAQGLPLWGNPRLTLPRSHPRPNVVLISVDTLRPDRLSLHGHERRTSPVLDEWARGSAAVFDAAVAQSPWTLPSHVSMLTGVDAFRHGVNFFDSIVPPALEFLAEMLRAAGYSTSAITGGALLHPRHGLGQGFDRYRYYPGSRATGDELSQGLDRALSWLDAAGDTPFFLFFHTYEVHTPWRSRQPWFDRFSDLPPVEDLRVASPTHRPEEGFLGVIRDSDLDLVRPGQATGLDGPELLELAGAAYDSGIAYADAQLGRLFSKLADTGLDRNTVVVFTSDHGELLGEHGILGHRYLYEENVRVPLVIATPGGVGAGRRIDSQVRSIDIVPTVLELVGLERPSGLDGRSLAPLIEGRAGAAIPAVAEAWTYAPETNYGISLRVGNRFKYTFNDTAWAPLNGTEAVWLLGQGADETTNVIADFDGVGDLYRALQEKIALVPGLRIRLHSGPDRRIRGAVRSPQIHPNRVKSIDLPCSCVTWESGGARFEVPPGSEYTLILQGGGTAPYALELASREESGGGEAREARYELRLPVGELGAEGRLFVALTDAGWQEFRSAPPSATRVEIWRHGPDAPAEAPTTVDPELLERLRVLGYAR